MKAYKVVLYNQGKYKSRIARKSAEIEYQLNKPVETPEWLQKIGRYPLLFSEPKYAIGFISVLSQFYHNSVVLECDCDDEVEIGRMCRIIDLEDGVASPLELGSFPEGTVSYKNVVPMEAYSVVETINTFLSENVRYVLSYSYSSGKFPVRGKLQVVSYSFSRFVEVEPRFVDHMIQQGNTVMKVYPVGNWVILMEDYG